jgi:hypothetical protein
MGRAVAADVHAGGRESAKVADRHVVAASDAVGDDVEGPDHPVPLEDGEDVGDRVAVPVVEREHHGLRRQGAALEERVVDLAVGHRVVPAPAQPGALLLEGRRLHREVGDGRRTLARVAVDAVVGEDGEAHRPRHGPPHGQERRLRWAPGLRASACAGPGALRRSAAAADEEESD